MNAKIIENHDELMYWMNLVEKEYGHSVLINTSIHFVSGTYEDGTTGHAIEITNDQEELIARSPVSLELMNFANKMQSVVATQGSQSLESRSALLH
ncbi:MULTISPECIES: hypothetical protein [unclassified Photobacterium]|uniref:hypothetical protein n=1 Tax=unclassified Photobacterium TaxID=2628852 RepID=UPI001EDD5515|nr:MULTISPECIES: hypothetical protein [unclassified Photobacterium]MCG3865507.1 hypothetical protein [Photobacterium sp. Ph6]MCG3877014.1 hypothetical protein [Photobacterium sp. Ph5]